MKLAFWLPTMAFLLSSCTYTGPESAVGPSGQEGGIARETRHIDLGPIAMDSGGMEMGGQSPSGASAPAASPTSPVTSGSSTPQTNRPSSPASPSFPQAGGGNPVVGSDLQEIPNSDPISFPKSSGGMCMRRGFSNPSPSVPGFGLVGSGPSDVSFRPLTMVVLIERKSKLTTEVTHSRCTGFLQNIRHAIAPLEQGRLASGAAMRRLTLPRITLSRHCLIENPQAPVTSISMILVEGSTQVNDYQTQQNDYLIDEHGQTWVVDRQGQRHNGPWVIPVHQLGDGSERGSQRDQCREMEVKSPAGRACFTSEDDVTHIITSIEADAQTKARELSMATLALEATKVEEFASQPIAEQESFKAGRIRWNYWLKQERSRFAMPLNADFSLGDDYLFSELKFSDLEQAKDYLNRHLYKISVVSSVIDSRRGDKPLYELYPDPKNGWSEVLEIFGEMESGRGHGDRFKIQSLALNLNFAKLNKGHSGTLMLGHWISASRPLLTVYDYRQVLGVLSTVRGDEVCIGDDLTCCEKVQ